jgi:hypothetical protein
MALIRPRLTDFHNIHLAQEEIDFAIPYLDEDIPFCVDPFLLWKSPSQQDNALHSALISSFNHLGYLSLHGKSEVGLGFSATRKGSRIGPKMAKEILNLFTMIPEIKKNGFVHFEEIQLYVDHISKDRISDITCSFLNSFLIDYTIDQCKKYNIPTEDILINNVYDQRRNTFAESEKAQLPVNPETKDPILLVPKRWLRKAPWINGDDYIKGYFLGLNVKQKQYWPFLLAKQIMPTENMKI